MILFVTLTIIVIFSLIFPSTTQAIIILPAIILIPIAQMVAVIVGGFSVPVISLGILIKTLTKNRKLAVRISVFVFILIIVISIFVLRWKNPDNPLF